MTPQVISLSAAGSTAWIPVDYKQNPFYINLALVLSDTPSLTCKVEYTLDNVFDSSITPTAFTHTGLSSVSTNTTGSITYPVRAIRLTVSSWTSGTVTLTALQGVTNPQIYTTTGSGSLIYKIPDWPSNTGILIASLVASSTASRTAGVVTITATGHGVTTGTTYVGFRFYYPGSTNLTAGWYDSVLTIPDANTITFSASGTDFTSESINSGVAWTTATDAISTVIPAGTLKDKSKMTFRCLRGGSTTGGSKTITLAFGGTNYSTLNLTTASLAEAGYSFRCLGLTSQKGAVAADGTGSTFLSSTTKDITVDQVFTVKVNLSVASEFLVLFGAYLEITQ